MAEYGYLGGTSSGGGSLNLPSYKQPKYDQGQVGLYAQQQMQPGLAKLRRQLTSSGAMYSENPAERDAMYRQLMAGYGQGLGELQAGATRAGQGLYAQEYSGLEKQAGMDYETAMKNWYLKQQEAEKKNALQDPRGPVPSTYSSWAEYDAAVARERPLGTTYQTTQGFAPTRGLGSTQSGLSSVASSNVTPMGYGAGSEEAYRKAIGQGELARGLSEWDLGGGKAELSLLDSSKGFNPYA